MSEYCQFHPQNKVTREGPGRVLICDECAADEELMTHAEEDWR